MKLAFVKAGYFCISFWYSGGIVCLGLGLEMELIALTWKRFQLELDVDEWEGLDTTEIFLI